MEEMEKKRILALDLGHKRIGVAISDPALIAAHPLGFIERTNLEEDLKKIAKLIEETGARKVVVGLPVRTDGKEGKEAQQAREFAEKIRQLGVEVILWDERFTSIMAERILIDQGVRREKRKFKRDAIAASLLLESYLESLR